MMDMTATTRLASLILGVDLGEWVAERRNAGKSWAAVSRDLSEATGGEAELSYESLRRYYGEPERVG